MARITRVKKAQQRYETVPVIDEATGLPKRTPVINKRTGEQKVSKRGPVFMTVTVQDKTKPLPPLKCDFSGCSITNGEILPGQSYKHISPKSGPYGGTQRNRHAEHPDWKVWEYSYSVGARAAQVQDEMHSTIDSFEFSVPEDFDDLASNLKEQADDFVSERDEAVSNMPEHLQDGSQAAEYLELAESWAEEFDQASAPEAEFEDCGTCEGEGQSSCDTCGGEGTVEEDDEDGHRDETCPDCNGTGEISCEDCEDGKSETLDEDWIEEAKGVLRDLVDGLEI